MAAITAPSERIDSGLTFGVKYERSQIAFMNVRCNWNEQMLQYCSTVFNNRHSRFIPVPRFPSFSTDGPILLPAPSVLSGLPHYTSPLPYHPSFSHLPDSVLRAVAVLSD